MFDLNRLRSAVEARLQALDFAWMENAWPLYDGGPCVQHLTLRREMTLAHVGNQVLHGGGNASNFDGAVIEWLYIVSPDFDHKDKRAFSRWYRRNKRKIDIQKAIEAIPDYMQRQRMPSVGFAYSDPDLPSKTSGNDGANESPFDALKRIVKPLERPHIVSHYLTMMHSHFGFTFEKTMDFPLPQLYALEAAIIASRGDETAIDYSSTYKDAYLRHKQK